MPQLMPPPMPVAQPQVRPMAASQSTSQFTWEEADSYSKPIITIYGPKGSGKTSAALGVSGKRYAISFDGKTKRIHETLYGNTPDITVLDGRKFFPNEDIASLPLHGAKSVAWIEYLLSEIMVKGDANYIIFDYLPTLAKICEMKMRKDHNLAASQGFSQLSWWEERNAQLRKFHRMALDAIVPSSTGKRCGVIYVSYIKVEETDRKDGEVVNSRKKPHYTDAIEQETDIVLYADSEIDLKAKSSRNFLVVESNKIWEASAKSGLASLQNGTILDLSGGRKLCDIVGDL